MLDSITKKRIDDLRNILVGKIPSPQSQVEQITTGLIYKFMYDMDQEAVEMGGIASFFVNDFEKYSWKNLFDPKLSGVQKVQLYGDAIEHMYTNPTAPQLFREIFKNSFLPFKDPATLNMFLKEINEFHYSHSEKLGDAFEYLLSFMGSQGDAGQFRTPRHIIDFVVEIINPQKNESVLDPACGTAGFLISSYKHILNQNTKDKIGDKLTALDRKRIGENLVGYDISPDMTRISLVNMYLHQFASPQIHEYDTLSSEDRWNEYYDVILANPPFFSPSGGIQPHTRFGVQSTRAEVLFVDYIIEHLKPNGRAGIIVPEGVIFQTGTAYKTLRKKLVEDCLIGVISLPAGVFQPYSGVKTSILILDKKLNKKSDHVFFAKIENDGFSLGAQRNQISNNDLPEIVDLISKNFLESQKEERNNFKLISKEKLSSKEYTFQASNYFEIENISSQFEIVKLRDYADFQRGTSITKKDVSEGNIPVIAGGQKPAYFHNQSNRKPNSITISSSGAYAGFVSFHPYPIFASDCFTITSNSEKLDQNYLFHLLKSSQEQIYALQSGGGQPHIYARDFENFEIPLPPVNVQLSIVEELNSYLQIIEGSKQVIQNYQPSFLLNPLWQMVQLKDISLDLSNGLNFSKEQVGHGTKFINVKDIFCDDLYINDKNLGKVDVKESEISKKKLNYGDLLFVRSSVKYEGVGYVAVVGEINEPIVFAGFIIKLSPDLTKVDPFYLCALLRTPQYRKIITSLGNRGTITNISQASIESIKIPLPPLSEQQKIVEMIKEELFLVSGSKKLEAIYTQKIKDNLDRVWGEVS